MAAKVKPAVRSNTAMQIARCVPCGWARGWSALKNEAFAKRRARADAKAHNETCPHAHKD